MCTLSRKKTTVLLVSLTSIVILMVSAGNVKAGEKAPPLTNAQCSLCHSQQPETIDAHGGKHKTEVGCMDCHREHRPKAKTAVPECSLCHKKAPHYKLANCSACHSDTHAPLDIKLEGDISDPCLTCHKQQGEEVSKHSSAHTDMACNECHSAHRKIPSCMECHDKHAKDMDFAACKSCHPVHMPLVVRYDHATPSQYCGACHKEAATFLKANKTKHHDLSCAYCHRDKHKAMVPCLGCHGSPHPEPMLEKHPKCGSCHNTAHDLR
ncbi:MAG: cytochrome C [Desulfobacterales bacterium]|nr:cytochrome C [Desulfobacterales bacterium]